LGVIVSVTAAVEDERHQTTTKSEGKEGAANQRDPAFGAERHVAEINPDVHAKEDRGGKEGQ
jgi:hypothetical protein